MKAGPEPAQVWLEEQRYRAVFENAAVGIAQVAPDGRWIEVNARFCEIVGYSDEEVRTLTFQDITHPDDLAADLVLVGRVLSGEIDHYRMEKRYLRRDGSAVWVDLSVGCTRTPDGRVDRFVSVVIDIDARKEAEQALARSEERLRLAGEVGNVGVWDWDIASGRVAWTPPQWRLHGLEPRDGLGYEEWRDCVLPDDRERFDTAALDAVASGGVLDSEYRVRVPGGAVRWLALRGRVLANGAGLPLRLTGISVDVTARKEAEERQRRRARVIEDRFRGASGAEPESGSSP